MKKWNKRIGLVTVFSAFLAACSFAVIGLNKTSVSADVEAGFFMEKGAAIRLPTKAESGYEDANGIRFKTLLTEGYYKQLQNTYTNYTIKFYTIVTTQSVSDINFLTYDLVSNTENSPTQAVEWTPTFAEDSTYTEYTSLINLPNTEYRRIITARSCAEIVGAGQDGGNLYVYAQANDNSRSMAGVAAAAVYDGTDRSQVKNYLGEELGSSTFSGYAVGEDKTTTLTVNGLSASGIENPIVMIGAKTVSATISGDEILIKDDLTALENGKTYNLSVVGSDGTFTSTVSYVESAIDSGTVIELQTEQNAELKLSDAVTEVRSATLNGVDILQSYSAETHILTIDKTKVPNSAAVLGEDARIFVQSNVGASLVTADVYTKIICVATELDKMYSEYAAKEKVGELTYGTTTQDVYSYDGYFVLGKNINYGGNVYQNGVTALSLNQCAAGNAVNITPKVGFKGVFDGQGFSISNIAFSSTISNQFITSSGLFGAIAQTGVVKNLALSVNSLTEAEGASAMAALLSGTLDNISVTTPVAGSNSGVRSGCLVHGTYGATLKNVFLNLTGTNGHRYYYGYISHFDYAVNDKATTATNVYVARSHNSQILVSANMGDSYNPYHTKGSGAFKNVVVYHNVKFSNGTYTDPTGDGAYQNFTNLTFKAYSDLAADTKNGTITFDDNSFWDLTGDVPAFKKKAVALDLSYVPVLEIQGNTQIDLSEVSGLFTTVNGAQLGNVDVYGSYADGVLTLDSAKIPNSAKDLGEDRTIIISTDNGDYSFKADIYTAIIDSATELDKMLSEYAAVTSVGKAKRAIILEMFSYDGYFVLGKNIDYTKDGARGVYNSGVSYLRTNYYLNGTLDNTAVINQAGFKGVFDGRGYSISNIQFSTTVNAQDGCFYTGGGLFGAIAQTGVVKNVALRNVALTNVDGNAPIAGNCCGTLDNIAIDMVMENATDVRTGGVVLGTLGAKLSNIFLHITGNGGHRFRYGYVSVYDHARVDGTGSIPTLVENVYVAKNTGAQYLVVTAETGEYNPYDDGDMGVFADVKVYHQAAPAATDGNYGAFAEGLDYRTYAQLAADLDASDVIVFDDMSYWDFTGAYPTFANKNA